MSTRNFSPQYMFEQWARKATPRYHFTGNTPDDFAAWKRAALPEVLATLGRFPDRVPLNPELEAEWEHDGLIKQRWLIDVQEFMSAVVLTARPKELPAGEKRPAICCWHGHGGPGKDAVMGTLDDHSPERPGKYDGCYGHRMAKDGFVTYALDWMAAGERGDARWPHFRTDVGGRDWCNLYYLHATMLGTTSIAINTLHGMAATDLLCSLPFVDAGRLGVMGASGGGTMTLWTALCDERVKAAEIIVYSGLWPDFGFRDINYCGMQVAPGLYTLVDLPDAQGLLAPRPLLVDIGAYDTCFHINTSMPCFRQLERIYQAAGISDRLELNLYPGEHGWPGNKSAAFFRKQLGGDQHQRSG